MLARTPMPTAKEIAERVAKSAKHLEIEAQLAALRAEHDGRRAKMLQLIQSTSRESHGTEINRLNAEVAEIAVKMGLARAELEPLRQEHGFAIAKALQPMRQEAAMELVEVLAQARALREVIDETQVVIERAGGSATRMPPIALNDIERAVKKIAGIKV